MGKRIKLKNEFMTGTELKKLVMSFINEDENYMERVFTTNPGTRTWKEMIDKYPNSMPARWYNSGFSDFEHYNDKEYVAVGYDCFETMSKKSVNALVSVKKKVDNSIVPYTASRIIKPDDVNMICNLNSFIDAGAGIGATTAMIKLAFPNAKVYYHNLRNSLQWKFAESLFNQLNLKIDMISDLSEVTEQEIDCVCALEFFEHFKEPFSVVSSFLKFKPKVLLDSTRFTQAAQGHFEHYTVDQKEVYHRKMPKIFKQFLEDSGYEYSYISDYQWNRYPTFFTQIK